MIIYHTKVICQERRISESQQNRPRVLIILFNSKLFTFGGIYSQTTRGHCSLLFTRNYRLKRPFGVGRCHQTTIKVELFRE